MYTHIFFICKKVISFAKEVKRGDNSSVKKSNYGYGFVNF